MQKVLVKNFLYCLVWLVFMHIVQFGFYLVEGIIDDRPNIFVTFFVLSFGWIIVASATEAIGFGYLEWEFDSVYEVIRSFIIRFTV